MIHNGVFSRHLFDRAKPGDHLITLGAGGVFVLPEDLSTTRGLFFFAAGTGIAPIFSLIKTSLATSDLPVVLIYSTSSETATLFFEPLKKLMQQYPGRFTVESIFSDSKLLSRSHLHVELIEDFVKRHGGTGHDKFLYYVCGPESYMRLCTVTLKRLHVPAEHIRKEIFDTSRPISPLRPPDLQPHTVTLLTSTIEHRVLVQHPITILVAAKREGIVLPYSCEVGRCGNCMAKCEKGKVWMSYNEVLTEKEIEEGYVLTCTGFPIEGDVVIRI